METYYLTPVESTPQVYYLKPVESNRQNYYLTPINSAGDKNEEWKFICTIAVDSSLWNMLSLNPGDYSGYIGYITLQSYESVKVEAVSGYFNDGAEIRPYRAFVNLVTKVDYATLGTYGEYDDPYYAILQFEGKAVELTIGDDKQLWWGVDGIATPNIGVMLIRVYAK
ncbi:MAG: hypothetical protein JW885_11575 [Deltaproteobacteria bacterium]|nr:hypothetical protein [Candidatus Zymogenaceae bacterium]